MKTPPTRTSSLTPRSLWSERPRFCVATAPLRHEQGHGCRPLASARGTSPGPSVARPLVAEEFAAAGRNQGRGTARPRNSGRGWAEEGRRRGDEVAEAIWAAGRAQWTRPTIPPREWTRGPSPNH